MELGTPGPSGLLISSLKSPSSISTMVSLLPFLLVIFVPIVVSDLNSFTMSAGQVDFSNCTMEGDGKCCVLSPTSEPGAERRPRAQIVECLHREEESCHYTYVTRFTPHQQEVCDENYKKKCTIVFVTQSQRETVQKCYRPLEKQCSGEGPEECRDYPETICTTRYIKKASGKFVQDTTCERFPRLLCGAGCSAVEGEEECHTKVIDSPVNLPEEHCDLSPQTTCHQVTRLVPRLEPQHECQRVPRQLCRPIQGPPSPPTPLMTKWCLQKEEEREGKSVQLGVGSGGEKRGGGNGVDRGSGVERRPDLGKDGRKGKRRFGPEIGNGVNTGSLGKKTASIPNLKKDQPLGESERGKSSTTVGSQGGSQVTKETSGLKSQNLKRDQKKNTGLRQDQREGKVVEESKTTNFIPIQLPQAFSPQPGRTSRTKQVSMQISEKLPQKTKNSDSRKKVKESLPIQPRPSPSPATLQAREFSSPSKTTSSSLSTTSTTSTTSSSSSSLSTTSSSTSTLQREGNIGHWIPAPSFAPFLPPSLPTAQVLGLKSQKDNRGGKRLRGKDDQQANRGKARKPGGTNRLGKTAKLSKLRESENLRTTNKEKDRERKPSRHSYLPQPGDRPQSPLNVPLLPPKKLSRLQLEEFKVIMPPKGRGVATVMRPPSAIMPAAKTPTKTAGEAGLKLPAPSKASKPLPSPVTVLSPPMSVEGSLPNLPPINATFSANLPVVKIALPQSKKIAPLQSKSKKPRNQERISSLSKIAPQKSKSQEQIASTHSKNQDRMVPKSKNIALSKLNNQNTLFSSKSNEEATPEPAPHQDAEEENDVEEASAEPTPESTRRTTPEKAREPKPERSREPKALLPRGRHRGGGGYLPSSSGIRQKGKSTSGAVTVAQKSENERQAKKLRNAKDEKETTERKRTGGGRKRKGGRNRGGGKRKRPGRRKKPGNVGRPGLRADEIQKKDKIEKEDQSTKEQEELKGIKPEEEPDLKNNREEVRINVAMRKMKNKVKLQSKGRGGRFNSLGDDGAVRGDHSSLDLPEIPLSLSSSPGRKGRKYEVGLRGKDLDQDEDVEDKDEDEEDLPFYSLPRFSSLTSLSRPPPQALLGLAGLAP